MATAQGREKEVVDSLARAIRQRLVAPAEERFHQLDGQVISLNTALHDSYREWRSAAEELEKRIRHLEKGLARAGKQIRGLALTLALLLAGVVFFILKGW
jgi:uncharacterized protein YlxW (UPF0749 family)